MNALSQKISNSESAVYWITGTLAQALSSADKASETYDVTVTGATLGDLAIASYSLDLGTHVSMSANVKQADHVYVTFFNNSGAPLSINGTIKVGVLKGI